jgi:sugar lactone lactonase YvrE
MPWQTVTTQSFELGESPFWHPTERSLYWVDIAGKQVLRMPMGTGTGAESGTIESWDMPSEPGCIAPAASGGLVIAMRHGVFRARSWGGALEHIATLPYDPAGVRANDGKCDALGRFWVGTVDEHKTGRLAALFSIDCRNGRAPVVQQHADGALTGNGLAWSPDNHTAFWADTSSHVLHAWDFDLQANTLSAHRLFQQFPSKPDGWQLDPHGAPDQRSYGGRPDGAAVDVQGNYYVAMYEGQRVCQFAPDGRPLAVYPTPAPCPTMPCFGGDDLQTLYLTSSRQKRNAAELTVFPASGCVFSMRVDVPGLPVNFFSD